MRSVPPFLPAGGGGGTEHRAENLKSHETTSDAVFAINTFKYFFIIYSLEPAARCKLHREPCGRVNLTVKVHPYHLGG